ncbi:hypothetical protein [Curtobacterium sp. MCJR17_043]|uniref:hypothetical protein n=1 Tax=Curtobacterium sp. MCJR17_043 TaxID=2175660 RepID=UPI0024DFF714|nr:hypothetical protein [Curtobacterium sp. MCJR17_043]WIB35500.1 hypothetical protein DEJ15_14935 [Curtobacterium sp. MCJR17_043]
MDTAAEPNPAAATRPSEPAWVEHVMWWHVYPLGFVGAEVRPDTTVDARPVEHRLGHLEGWLDHVVDLGLNGLLLGPVFASSSHGYDTVDHFRIDPPTRRRRGLRPPGGRCARAGDPRAARRRLQPRRP